MGAQTPCLPFRLVLSRVLLHSAVEAAARSWTRCTITESQHLRLLPIVAIKGRLLCTGTKAIRAYLCKDFKPAYHCTGIFTQKRNLQKMTPFTRTGLGFSFASPPVLFCYGWMEWIRCAHQTQWRELAYQGFIYSGWKSRSLCRSKERSCHHGEGLLGKSSCVSALILEPFESPKPGEYMGEENMSLWVYNGKNNLIYKKILWIQNGRP